MKNFPARLFGPPDGPPLPTSSSSLHSPFGEQKSLFHSFAASPHSFSSSRPFLSAETSKAPSAKHQTSSHLPCFYLEQSTSIFALILSALRWVLIVLERGWNQENDWTTSWSVDQIAPHSFLSDELLLPSLFHSSSLWTPNSTLRHSSQTSTLDTQYLVLDDCVPDPLGFVLIYNGPFVTIGSNKIILTYVRSLLNFVIDQVGRLGSCPLTSWSVVRTLPVHLLMWVDFRVAHFRGYSFVCEFWD